MIKSGVALERPSVTHVGEEIAGARSIHSRPRLGAYFAAHLASSASRFCAVERDASGLTEAHHVE